LVVQPKSRSADASYRLGWTSEPTSAWTVAITTIPTISQRCARAIASNRGSTVPRCSVIGSDSIGARVEPSRITDVR
jgi:hypothetical protein